MRKILGFILSPLTLLAFMLVLLIFQPVQWLSLKLGGYSAHKKSVDILNFWLTGTLYLTGNTVTFINKQNLPIDRPMIFVANHQSLLDIPPLIYHLRKYHAKFISKIELTKNIPSISYNLKHGGGANIDRNDPRQSMKELSNLGTRMKENTWSTVIFPEGTRSKTGKVKAFQSAGIAMIFKKCPDALLVPIAINNSWKIVQYGFYPLNTFISMTLEVLKPIERGTATVDEVVQQAEREIKKALGQA